MIDKLHEMGATSRMAFMGALAAIVMSVTMWFFRRGGERESAERLAVFVGLWPPTLIQLGRLLEERE